MAQSRYINTRFWKDNYIAGLNSSDKLLFLYLITNQNTNIAGIYEIALAEIAFDTGIDTKTLQIQLDKFTSDGKIYYVEGHIIVRNFINHQSDNMKIQQGIMKIIEKLPSRLRKFILLNDNGLWLDSGELKGDLTLLTDKINEQWVEMLRIQEQNRQQAYKRTKYNKVQG